MCGSPSVPKPLPQRQAAQAPDQGSIARRASENLKRRLGFAGTVMTPSLMGQAVTTGKTLLGA